MYSKEEVDNELELMELWGEDLRNEEAMFYVLVGQGKIELEEGFSYIPFGYEERQRKRVVDYLYDVVAIKPKKDYFCEMVNQNQNIKENEN